MTKEPTEQELRRAAEEAFREVTVTYAIENINIEEIAPIKSLIAFLDAKIEGERALRMITARQLGEALFKIARLEAKSGLPSWVLEELKRATTKGEISLAAHDLTIGAIARLESEREKAFEAGVCEGEARYRAEEHVERRCEITYPQWNESQREDGK